MDVVGKLTEVELELMTIVWENGPGTVREVMSGLPEERAVAYTTVSTMLRILVDKGFLRADPEGRSHRYHPMVARRAYQSAQLKRTVADVFAGNPMSLVHQMVDDDQLSASELAELLDQVRDR